ncbi:hypothetical protein D7X12_15400 [Corallococcus sicarius]|uniref:Uncharacterized protein n=1 Tax=Corallococcus sicarius TaxID=2316726 RepID=A0A3A8NE36_9BACT|nr:hypothetical protein D7X12_15400 [Corallococcus sicarius]
MAVVKASRTRARPVASGRVVKRSPGATAGVRAERGSLNTNRWGSELAEGTPTVSTKRATRVTSRRPARSSGGPGRSKDNCVAVPTLCTEGTPSSVTSSRSSRLAPGARTPGAGTGTRTRSVPASMPRGMGEGTGGCT